MTQIPKPCPFCGGKEVAIAEGSTFRWRYAFCTNCDARGHEIRIQTLGKGTQEEWEAKAKAKVDAIAAWNERFTEVQP